MSHAKDSPLGDRRLWWSAIATAVLVGVIVRVSDPLSTSVIPAEDPYTHMALVQDHVWNGVLEPLHSEGDLYPPGMHAGLAAVWVFSGIGLYEVFRFAPVVFGAVGILGVALLLDRFDGGIAAALGAFAYALAPEVAFRTTMMAPTAVDLAVLPFLFIALLKVVEGEVAWLGLAVPLSVFLIFSHPWVFMVLALASAVLVPLAYLAPWPAERAPRPSPAGLTAALAVIAGGLGLTLVGCWGACGPGFAFVVGHEYAPLLTQLAYPLLGLAALFGILVATIPGKLDLWIPTPRAWNTPRKTLATVAFVGLLAATVPAVQQGMPPNVDLPFMMGWPLLVAAAVGFVAFAFVPSPAMHWGASIAVTTYPFVVYNTFDSPFWSHRTAVFLSVGLVLMAAAVTSRLITWLARRSHRAGSAHQKARVPFASLAPIFLVGAMVGGLWMGTAGANSDRDWYRLYDECEMEAMQDIASLAEEDTSTVLIVGDWRPQLVLAAQTTDNWRVWFIEEFYTESDPWREGVLEGPLGKDRSVIVVVDPHLTDKHPDVTDGSLHDGSWDDVSPGPCDVDDAAPHHIEAYRIDPEA